MAFPRHQEKAKFDRSSLGWASSIKHYRYLLDGADTSLINLYSQINLYQILILHTLMENTCLKPKNCKSKLFTQLLETEETKSIL